MVETAAARHLISARARNIIISHPVLSTQPPFLNYKFLKLKLKLNLLSDQTSKIISRSPTRNDELSVQRYSDIRRNQSIGTCSFLGLADLLNTRPSNAAEAAEAEAAISLIRNNIKLDDVNNFMLADLNLNLDPATAKLAIGLVGPFLSAFSFLFILRVVMSWYPKIPLGKLPYVIAYAPTEPFLVQTRKLIPPLAGVDITPVVWVGLLNFLNEILVGPQGLLVLLSQQLSN